MVFFIISKPGGAPELPDDHCWLLGSNHRSVLPGGGELVVGLSVDPMEWSHLLIRWDVLEGL